MRGEREGGKEEEKGVGEFGMMELLRCRKEGERQDNHVACAMRACTRARSSTKGNGLVAGVARSAARNFAEKNMLYRLMLVWKKTEEEANCG